MTPCLSTSTRDDRPLRRNVPRRRGFTLVEAATALASLAVLAGMLFPALEKARQRDRINQAHNDAKGLVMAMQQIFRDDGDFPLTLRDPRLMEYVNDLAPALASRLEKSLNDGENLAPYYILSVRPGGIEGDYESWDFRIAVGTGMNPVHLPVWSNRGIFDAGVVGRREGFSAPARLFRTGALVSIVPNDELEGDDYWWPWDNAAAPPPNLRPYYNLPYSLMIARAAESATPLLEDHPELSTQIRAYMKQPETTTLVLSRFSPSWFAPFDDILQLSDDEIDDLSEMDLTNLQGDPAFLFSYESLRVLSTLYSKDDAVAFGLMTKLDAAEAAENQGKLSAKRGQIKLFQSQVSWQSGKALTANQARTLLALVKTL